MKRLSLNLSLTGVIVLIAVGVLLPVMLSTAAGIVAIVLADDAGSIVTAALVVCFAVAAAGCALIAVILASRKARLARQQADFLANVSHELRTPLSTIRLYTQTLQSGKLTADPLGTANCLATILRETEWLDALVNRVLTWRSASRDAVPLKMETAPIQAAVDGAVARFLTMVRSDGLQVDVSNASTLPVHHDTDALMAVIINLLTNAYKYTGEEKWIRISSVDADDHVVLEVADNGCGLSRADAHRIFQPFFRAGNKGRKQAASGVGLGLGIARFLIERHGGTIAAKSQPDKGTTFTVRLPTVEAHP